MITEEMLLSIDKSAPEKVAADLTDEEIKDLIPILSRKEDAIRYPAFLLLQSRSRISPDVYMYWDIFRAKIIDDYSYQRSIGMMLLAENTRSDREGKANDLLGAMITLLSDEKPITVRQTIQSLEIVGLAQPALRTEIRNALIDLDLLTHRETMRKSILSDILHALIILKDETEEPSVDTYIIHALTGVILDTKTKKIMQKLREGETR